MMFWVNAEFADGSESDYENSQHYNREADMNIADYCDAIEIIESAKADWYAEQIDFDVPTDDDTDEHINRILDVRQIRVMRGGEWEFDGTAEEIRDAVWAGLNAWKEEVSA